jgi:hypothetical protein
VTNGHIQHLHPHHNIERHYFEYQLMLHMLYYHLMHMHPICYIITNNATYHSRATSECMTFQQREACEWRKKERKRERERERESAREREREREHTITCLVQKDSIPAIVLCLYDAVMFVHILVSPHSIALLFCLHYLMPIACYYNININVNINTELWQLESCPCEFEAIYSLMRGVPCQCNNSIAM